MQLLNMLYTCILFYCFAINAYIKPGYVHITSFAWAIEADYSQAIIYTKLPLPELFSILVKKTKIDCIQNYKNKINAN